MKSNLKNKAVMWAAVGCVLAVTTVVGVKPAQAQDGRENKENKPNVVLMLSDNMGYGDLGAYGSGGELRGMPTPRIDKLASEGLMLTQFFVEPG